MTPEQERAEFEAWANGRCELHVNPAGRYSSAITQFAWEAYQAGRAALTAAQEAPAQAAQAVPNGWPPGHTLKDLTREMTTDDIAMGAAAPQPAAQQGEIAWPAIPATVRRDVTMLAGYAEGSKSAEIVNTVRRVINWLNADRIAAQAHEAAPAAQGELSAWHRIEEDAEVDVPLDTDLLLAWWDEWSEAWKIEVNYAGSERSGWRHGRATHWMPLPAPPSAAQQKGGEA